MLCGLQLHRTQKVVLAGIFSLGSVIAVFDILRTVESLQSGTFSGVALWSSLEVTVAVIVASLPLYRVLLSKKGRDSLLSRVSLLQRYRDISERQTVERKGSDDTSTQSGKPRVTTFRDDLEAQDMVSSRYKVNGHHFRLEHL